MGFDILGLSEPILKAVADSGYTEPTPIQVQAIPQVLMGRDVLGIAQTGTGKTASFTLPMIDILSQGRGRARMPRSLILEPTRELAAQVAESFEKYGKNHKLSMALLIGGVNFADQEKALDRGVDVLIATPGRLLDHFGRGKLLLTGVDVLVIDEADRMLDMGFIPDVEEICKKINKKHQTLFFSATMAPMIKRLTDQFLDDPKKIEVARPATTAKTIKQHLVKVSHYKKKRLALRALLDSEDIKNALIFCNRKKDVKEVYASLIRHNYSVGQLHGDMAQSERLATLASFKENNIQLLVASDVAARGLDVPDISHVFNFDVPSHAEDYVHRIGRTGRAGREGNAFTITTGGRDDTKYLRAIENMTKEKIELLEGLDIEDKKAKPSAANKQKSEKNPHTSAQSQTSLREQDNKQSDHHRSRGRQAHPNSNSNSNPNNNGRPQQRRDQRDDRYHQETYRRRNPEDIVMALDDWPKKPHVGMGPHVPAFMQTTIKLPSSKD